MSNGVPALATAVTDTADSCRIDRIPAPREAQLRACDAKRQKFNTVPKRTSFPDEAL
jgi:hypothetical protein